MQPSCSPPPFVSERWRRYLWRRECWSCGLRAVCAQPSASVRGRGPTGPELGSYSRRSKLICSWLSGRAGSARPLGFVNATASENIRSVFVNSLRRELIVLALDSSDGYQSLRWVPGNAGPEAGARALLSGCCGPRLLRRMPAALPCAGAAPCRWAALRRVWARRAAGRCLARSSCAGRDLQSLTPLWGWR